MISSPCHYSRWSPRKELEMTPCRPSFRLHLNRKKTQTCNRWRRKYSQGSKQSQGNQSKMMKSFVPLCLLRKHHLDSTQNQGIQNTILFSSPPRKNYSYFCFPMKVSVLNSTHSVTMQSLGNWNRKKLSSTLTTISCCSSMRLWVSMMMMMMTPSNPTCRLPDSKQSPGNQSTN